MEQNICGDPQSKASCGPASPSLLRPLEVRADEAGGQADVQTIPSRGQRHQDKSPRVDLWRRNRPHLRRILNRRSSEGSTGGLEFQSFLCSLASLGAKPQDKS